MRKELLSLVVVALLISTPCFSFATENQQSQTSSIQYAPAETNYGYQTQYPLPSTTYQHQGYHDINYTNNSNNKLQGNVIMVPVNTAFQASVMTPLSSATARLGDSVTFYLGSDFYYGNNLVAPAGSKINGIVLLAKKAGLANRSGKLQVKFTNIVTPTGQMIPVSARIQTLDGTGILQAGTAKDAAVEYAKDTGVGAAAGAVLGTAMGALSGGSVGKGAIYGTAVGGGMGLIKTVFEKGGNVEIPQNAQMNIVIDQPITVSSNSPY